MKLNLVNVGKIKKNNNENYPIRKGVITKNSLTDKEVNEIYNLLINTKLSIRKMVVCHLRATKESAMPAAISSCFWILMITFL